MAYAGAWRWNLICAGLLLGFAVKAVGQEPQNSANVKKSGVQLSGRSADETPLNYWYLYDAKGKQAIARISRRWGFAPVPPGEYQIKIMQESSTLDWSKVTVKEGAVTQVELNSGIELAGASEGTAPMDYWYVFDSEGKKQLTYVSKRWGFTPLPAGEYVVKVRQGSSNVTWSNVTVKPGEVTEVKIDSGIQVVGASEGAPPLDYWYVFDSQGKKQLTYVTKRWGFTPLPAGEYVVKVRQGSSNVPWSNVTVKPGEVTEVKIDSGIQIVGASKDAPPLDYWYVFDSQGKKQLTYIHKQWGSTPVPPGEHVVKVQQGGSVVTWGSATVKPGEVTEVKIDAGIQVVGASEDAPPLDYWYVFDSQGKKQLTYVHKQWGSTPVPPGEYVVKVQRGGSVVTWSNVTVKPGEVAKVEIDSGIEVVGASKDAPPLDYWYVFDSQGKKQLTYIHKQWGSTPVPPGEYVVKVQQGGSAIVWSTVAVESGEVRTVRIDSGIELTGSKPSSTPPKYSNIYAVQDLTRHLTYFTAKWGFAPVPPGHYIVGLTPTETERVHIRWALVNVSPGQIATLNVEMPLADRLRRIDGTGRKTERELDPEGYKKLEEDVERAIRRGAAWLKKQNQLSSLKLQAPYPTIGILALVHADELERDSELAKRCLDYLLRRPLRTSSGTYATALTAMALRDIDPYRYRQRIFECAKWLVENQGAEAAGRLVWGYGDAVPGVGEQKEVQPQRARIPAALSYSRSQVGVELDVVRQGLITKPSAGWDNSCSQFAVLGLHSSAKSGVMLPRQTWQQVDEHFGTVQSGDGGWGYTGGSGYGSMTCAGLASRVIARHHLGMENPKLDPSVINALEWLAAHFTVEKNPKSSRYHYYYLYGLERAGILAGTEFFGDHEWYPIGARYLVREQNADGAWRSGNGSGQDYLDTCYAILFLRRATLPLEPAQPAFLRVTYEKGILPPALMPAVELILDSSGSMEESVQGRQKSVVAREITAQVLANLPDDRQVGLRLFGHWGRWVGRIKDPNAGAVPQNDPQMNKDSQLVVSIGRLTEKQRQRITTWLNWAKPRGKTPLVYSLLEAKSDFPSSLRAAKTVVLVSDGQETCGGNLEDVAAAYQNAGIGVTIHVVGFNVQKDQEATKQLQRIASIGGGKYFGANNAQQLAAALGEAVQGMEFVVLDPSSGKQVARGMVNDEPVALAPGTYQVQLSGPDSKPVTIELSAGTVGQIQLGDEGKLLPPAGDEQAVGDGKRS